MIGTSRLFAAGSRAVLGAAAVASCSLWIGCATISDGPSQWVRVDSGRPGARVLAGAGATYSLPAEFKLRRADDDQVLSILHPRPDSLGGFDTTRLRLERTFGYTTLANALFGAYGLAGLALDAGTGAIWRQEPGAAVRVPRDLKLDFNPHPWSTGEWRGSLGWSLGFKHYPAGVLTDGGVGGDAALQLVLGLREWPVSMEARAFLASSLKDLGNDVVLEIGPRKSWGRGDFRPYASGGLSVLERSTPASGGLPWGAWVRGGLDIRLGSAVYFAPYLGYSKYEIVFSENTGGVTGGAQFGILW